MRKKNITGPERDSIAVTTESCDTDSQPPPNEKGLECAFSTRLIDDSEHILASDLPQVIAHAMAHFPKDWTVEDVIKSLSLSATAADCITNDVISVVDSALARAVGPIDNRPVKRPAPALGTLQQKGLDCEWWMWWNESTQITNVMTLAFLQHWHPSVKAALEKNAGTSRPSSFSRLAKAIRRVRGSVSRHKTSIPNTLLSYCYASALGVPHEQLVPTTRELLSPS